MRARPTDIGEYLRHRRRARRAERRRQRAVRVLQEASFTMKVLIVNVILYGLALIVMFETGSLIYTLIRWLIRRFL